MPALLKSPPRVSRRPKSRSLTPQKPRGFGMTCLVGRPFIGMMPRELDVFCGSAHSNGLARIEREERSPGREVPSGQAFFEECLTAHSRRLSARIRADAEENMGMSVTVQDPPRVSPEEAACISPPRSPGAPGKESERRTALPSILFQWSKPYLKVNSFLTMGREKSMSWAI